MDTSPLICKANQWTGFYILGTSIMKELDYDSYPLSIFDVCGIAQRYLTQTTGLHW